MNALVKPLLNTAPLKNNHQDFFQISVQAFANKERSLLCDLYLYIPRTNEYLFEWKAHRKVTRDQIRDWEKCELSGLRLAILSKDKNKLFLELGIKIEKDLQQFLTPLQKDDITLIKEHANYKKNLLQEISSITLPRLFTLALRNNQFLPVIQYVQKKILTFDINESETVSNARAFSELLVQDNHHLRSAAISVLYGEFLGFKDQQALSDIFCASLLKDMGLIFLNNRFLQEMTSELSKPDLKEYWQHGKMTDHLLQKSGIKLSARCLNLIKQHHELPSGNGQPLGLGPLNTDELSYLIGMVDTLFQYAESKFVNTKLTLLQICETLEKKKDLPGLIPYPKDQYKNLALFLLQSNSK